MILKRKTEKTSRSYKVSELIRKAVSEVLVRNELPLENPFNFPISVIKVEMNSDLKVGFVRGSSNTKLLGCMRSLSLSKDSNCCLKSNCDCMNLELSSPYVTQYIFR